MNFSSFVRPSLWSVLLTLAVGLVLPAAAQPACPTKETLNIEQAMRAWQERYSSLTGADQIYGLSNPNYYKQLTWPRNLAGENPGPYPRNCFYADDMQKPERAAVLVAALAQAIKDTLNKTGQTGSFGVIRRFDPYWADWGTSPINGGPFTASILAKFFFWRDAVSGTYAVRLPTDSAWAPDLDATTITKDNYSTKFETLIAHWLANPVKVKWYAASTGGTGNSRNFGVVLDGAELVACSDCSTCASGCRPGECSLRTEGGLDIRVNMGTGSKGSLGLLRLRAEATSSALYTPRALVNLVDGRIVNSSSGSTPEAYAIYDYAQCDAAGLPLLRQVFLPQGLVDIVGDGTGITLKFYDPSNRGATPPVGGFFTPGSSYKTIRIEQNGGIEHLRLTESGEEPTTVSLFDYADNAWSKQEGSATDARTEQVASSWTSGSGIAVGDNRQETRTLLNSASVTVDKTRRQYRIFPWNIDPSTSLPFKWSNRREELVQETIDPDAGGKQLTTTYRFYDDVAATDANYGRVKQVERPDGSWERYEYAADGRVTKTYSSFSDAQSPAVASGAISGDYRLIETTYSTVAPQETTTESLVVGGVVTVIGRRFRAIDDTALTMTVFRDAVATSATAVYSDTSNLVTVLRLLKTGYFAGRTERIVRPDGTLSLYSYTFTPATAQTTTTVREGVPTGTDPIAAGGITDGTATVTVTNAQGQPISEIVTDGASGIQLTNTVYADFDAFGRWRLATYNDGTTSTRTYNCCGLESETDRSGLRTFNIYDSLTRVTRQTVYLGTTATVYSDTEFTFDAAGRTLKTIQHAASASLDVTLPATITATDNTYNSAGQLVCTVTPRGSTSLVETITAEGKRQVTTTFADAGTSVEQFNRAGELESVLGTAAAPKKCVYGVDVSGLFVKEIKIGEAGAETEWVKNYRDFAGRSADTVFADGAKIVRTYYAADNTTAGRRGKLASETLPANSDAVGSVGRRTLFDYNARGEQEIAAVDLDQDGVIDYAGTDRISKTASDVASVTHDSVAYNVRRSTTSVWANNDTDAASAVAVSEMTTDGLRSWQTSYGLLTAQVVSFSGNGGRTVTITSPDTTIATQNYVGDRVQSGTVALGVTQLSRTDYQYDGYGRAEQVTDARNGATTYTFYNDGLQKTVTTPDPDVSKSGPGYDVQKTQFFYDSMGRLTRTVLSDAAETYASYWPTGAPKRSWGARTMPHEMTYDAQGRMKTSATWRSFTDETSFDSTVGKTVTTWNYSAIRGWLDNKRFADNRGPDFLHYPSGALKRRTWARTVEATALTTDYSYTTTGDLAGVDYSDSTPDVSGLAYDRLGRRTSVTDAAGTLTTSYEGLTSFADDETYAVGSGALAGFTVNRTRDSQLRPSTLVVPSISSVGYSYRDGSRLDTLSATVNGTSTDHTYTYQANSSLIDQLVQKRGGVTVLTTTRRFDKLNRLVSNAAVSSTATTNSAAYLYNSANQRTRLTGGDGRFWDYGYDSLGQVTAGAEKLSDGTPVPGHAFGYAFDTIGNLATTTVNGQSATYTPDIAGLNQYTQRTVPGSLDVLGTADAGAKVAVNLTQSQRQGDLFYSQLSVGNASAPKWQAIDVLVGKAGAGAGGLDAITRQSGHLFLAQTPEQFGYDFDGNLTSDGQWSFTWDAESQLVAMETVAAAVSAGVPKQKLEFEYDSAGRRIQKKVSNWNGAAYFVASDTRFLYDDWNLLAELNGSMGGAVINSYVWGLDLSGSAQGAGGIGGLLAVSAGSATHLPTFDGNGNVSGLVAADSGQRTATYTYGPFGEPISAFGSASTSNHIRYSTKYTDEETDLIYYMFRYYSPSQKRWISRDPIEEEGGANLYAMVVGNPVNEWDYLGLQCSPTFEIPKVVMDGMKDAWSESFLPGDKFLEQGGRIFNSKKGVYVKRDNTGGEGDISQASGRSGVFGIIGNRRLGDFHTHGYNKRDGGHVNVSFSGDDIDLLRKYSNGQAMYVLSGDSVFILVNGDKDRNSKEPCASAALRWQNSYKASRDKNIAVPAAAATAVLAAIKNCCMCYYIARAPKPGSAIPTTAKLVNP